MHRAAGSIFHRQSFGGMHKDSSERNRICLHAYLRLRVYLCGDSNKPTHCFIWDELQPCKTLTQQHPKANEAHVKGQVPKYFVAKDRIEVTQNQNQTKRWRNCLHF